MKKSFVVLDLLIIFDIKDYNIEFEFFKNIKIYLKNSNKVEMHQNTRFKKCFLKFFEENLLDKRCLR